MGSQYPTMKRGACSKNTALQGTEEPPRKGTCPPNEGEQGDSEGRICEAGSAVTGNGLQPARACDSHMSTQNYVAFDLGAESGRAVLGAFDGERLDLHEVHRFPNRPVRVSGHLHWDVLRLYDEIQNGLELAAHQVGEIAGIGVDTWGVDYALLDRSGELLGNPWHYRDLRTDGIMEEVFRRVPRERIFQTTGIQFLQLNTLYQLFATLLTEPHSLDIADTLLLMPDLMHFWLTGVKVSEFSIATTTQFYDPRARDWARPLLQELGIPPRLVPPLVSPGNDLGRLVSASKMPALEHTRVITPASHDTASAVAAVPARSDDYAYISSGTWSLMGVEVREPIINDQMLRYNFTNEGAASGDFQLLKNLTGLWLLQECRRAWSRQGREYSYADLLALAAQAPPFAALIDPDDHCFLNPDDMPTAIAQYAERTRQAPPRAPGDMVRCTLESLALKYRQTLGQLETVVGRHLPVIHIVGGGSQNQTLCQMTADACARPVLAGPVEATALGNILVQMLAKGRLGTLEQGRSLVRASFPVATFEPREASAWNDAYARFLSLFNTLGKAA